MPAPAAMFMTAVLHALHGVEHLALLGGKCGIKGPKRLRSALTHRIPLSLSMRHFIKALRRCERRCIG
jgi:hypothetical protein